MLVLSELTGMSEKENVRSVLVEVLILCYYRRETTKEVFNHQNGEWSG